MDGWTDGLTFVFVCTSNKSIVSNGHTSDVQHALLTFDLGFVVQEEVLSGKHVVVLDSCDHAGSRKISIHRRH